MRTRLIKLKNEKMQGLFINNNLIIGFVILVNKIEQNGFSVMADGSLNWPNTRSHTELWKNNRETVLGSGVKRVDKWFL
jgi:hypothetical protein